jgi:large subunit ribosomal protein L25
MSKQVALAARARDGGGKAEARTLRRQGRVPAIAYGRQLEPTPISVDALELYHALHTAAGENAILRLDVDGRTQLALARGIQRHPVRRDVLHVDFVTVSRDVKVTVDVPVVLAGEAPGVTEGGVADQSLHTVQLEVLPLEVPDQLVLDVSDMQIGDVKRVADLPLPEGVQLSADPDAPIVSIVPPTVEIAPEEAVAEEEAEGATAEEARASVAAAERSEE